MRLKQDHKGSLKEAQGICCWVQGGVKKKAKHDSKRWAGSGPVHHSNKIPCKAFAIFLFVLHPQRDSGARRLRMLPGTLLPFPPFLTREKSVANHFLNIQLPLQSSYSSNMTFGS